MKFVGKFKDRTRAQVKAVQVNPAVHLFRVKQRKGELKIGLTFSPPQVRRAVFGAQCMSERKKGCMLCVCGVCTWPLQVL